MTSQSHPETIAIREATIEDASGIARVHVDSWRSTYRGIVPDTLLENLSYQRRADQWLTRIETAPPDVFHVVAENAAGEIVGFAGAGPNRDEESAFRAELYAIYLLPNHQGRGVGRRLIGEVAFRLVQQDMRSMIVWVLAENRARYFYEALGGEPCGEKEITIGVPLREIAYGWQDVSILLLGGAVGVRGPR